MSIPIYKKVSSLEAIVSTIKTDQQVLRWFLFLISQPVIQAKLKNTDQMATLYSNLKRTISRQRSLYQIIFCSGLFIFFLNQWIYFWLGIIALYPCIKLYRTKKSLVVKISSYLISSDFRGNDLSEKTLFQISELYSKKYQIAVSHKFSPTGDGFSRSCAT